MNRKLLQNYGKFIDGRMNTNKQFVYSPFASTFKNARLAQNKTLQSVVRDTCSLSYVSKYENNLIMPDETVLSVLFDNVGIDYKLLAETDMSNYLPSIIRAYLRNDVASLEDLYTKAESPFFIAQNVLATIFYYLATKQFVRCAEEIEKVDNVKTTLNDYQILLLASVTIEFFILTNRYKEAYELLQIQKNMFKDYPEIMALYNEERFLVAFTLKDNLHILPYYKDLQKNYLYVYPLKKQIRNKMLYLETQWTEDLAYEEIINMGYDYIPDEYYFDYIFSKYIIMLKKQLYEQVILDYHNLTEKSVGLRALYSFAVLNIFNNPNLANQYQSEINYLNDEFKNIVHDRFNEQEYLFVKLILMHLHKEEALEIMDFMKSFILPQLDIKQHRFYTDFFVKSYIEVLKKLARYKEAMNFTSKYLPYINNLNNIDF